MSGFVALARMASFFYVRAAAANVVNHVWEVGYFEANPDGHAGAWVQAINGSLPGPLIKVRRHDRLRVTVINKLATEELSIHWHGFEMRGAQEFDGAMGVTQCGIKPGDTFTYDFEVDELPGTYQYHEHAHLGHVAARGLFGPLVVLPEEDTADVWKHDQDFVLMLSDWWEKSAHELERLKQAKLVALLPFTNVLINGKGRRGVFSTLPIHDPLELHLGDLETIVPRRGETWRLRVINGGALFALRFRIDSHRLRVIQADAADVEPYDCDVVIVSSGERFDILVTFDQSPGSYWMRVETLEQEPGLHHGQLGVVRYEGTLEGSPPNKGYPRVHRLEEAASLVTLNCIDQGPISPTCRPITDLRRRPGIEAHVGDIADATHDFEVSMRGFAGESPSHFTRLLDLGVAPPSAKSFGTLGNTLGENQFDGQYVQFHLPRLPYSHRDTNGSGDHPNTLAMHVELGEIVRVVLQLQDRAAHAWHLHGHKFAVLGVGFPDYEETCDVLYCRSKLNHWLTRDGLRGKALLDIESAPLKDTVHVPAGGWVVVQFKADNPGWWFFHCHMQIHAHDGMGLVLVEGVQHMPGRLFDAHYLASNLPSCDKEKKETDRHTAISCHCWQSPEMKLDDMPRSTYLCSQAYLCSGDDISLSGEHRILYRVGDRKRADGRLWRFGMLGQWLLLVTIFWGMKIMSRRISSRAATAVAKLIVHVGDGTADLSKTLRLPGTVARIPSNCLELDDLPKRGMALHFHARCKGATVQGMLPAGSTMVVVGQARDANTWLEFFAGNDVEPAIAGGIALDRRPMHSWSRRQVRVVCSLINKTMAFRPHCTVMDAIDLPLRLRTEPQIWGTGAQRREHLARVVGLLSLEGVLHKPLRNLTREELLRVRVAQEVAVPRAILVIVEPLDQLPPKEALRLAAAFHIISRTMGTTVIISCGGWLSEELGPFFSHCLWASSLSPPAFEKVTRLGETLAAMGMPPSPGVHPLAWASELNLKCISPGLVRANRRPSLQFVRRSLVDVMASETQADVGTPRSVFVQFWVLFRYAFSEGLEDNITIYRFLETLGIGVLAGLVWFQKGSDDTQTALGESIGLFFFSCALFTVPPFFQALAMCDQFVKQTISERASGMYTVPTATIAAVMATVPTLMVWVAVWQWVAYSLADLGRDPDSVLMMNLVLGMNMLSVRTLAMVLYLLVPSSKLNVVIGNLVVQMFMLTNGFYTTLPDWLQWITYLSIPRLTFRALLKLEYTWRDTFVVHPMQGTPGFGFPVRYIPAELTQIFQLMHVRQVDVMQSPHASSAWPDVLFMAGIIVWSVFSFIGTLCLRMWMDQRPQSISQTDLEELDQFIVRAGMEDDCERDDKAPSNRSSFSQESSA